jgi:hypothetical protein
VDQPGAGGGAPSVTAIPFTTYGYSNFFAVRLVAPL